LTWNHGLSYTDNHSNLEYDALQMSKSGARRQLTTVKQCYSCQWVVGKLYLVDVVCWCHIQERTYVVP